jgi:hypothetical protein
MAMSRKKVILACFVLVFGTWSSLTSAADSSEGSFSGSVTTPTVTSNQPYLLDTGYADVSTAEPGVPGPSTYPAAGSVWGGGGGWTYWGAAGAPPAIRLTIYTNPRLCPPGISKPVVTLSPYKSLAQGSESMRACADAITHTPDGKRYWFGVWVNTVTNSAGTLLPATSFYWSVYCYPQTSNFSNTTNPIAISAAPGGACAPANSTYTPQILLWSSGIVNSTSTTTSNTFTLPRACPTSYTPYVIMGLTNPSTRYTGVSYGMAGVGVCVTGVSGTTVTYLKGIQSLQTDSYRTTLADGYWIGEDAGAWTSFSTKSAQSYMDKIDSSISPGYHVVNKLKYDEYFDASVGNKDTYTYQLYCYPQGLSVPAAGAYCSTANFPFK